MSNTCEYCNTTFSTKYVLVRHINSSKKCLDLRNNNYKCEFCDFNTTLKTQYDTHFKKCEKEYKNNLIIEMKAEIKRLNSELEYNKQLLDKQMNKPTNNITTSDSRSINNNTVSNKLNINVIHDGYKKLLCPVDELDEKFPQFMEENFTEKDLKKGIKGVAEVSSKLLYGNPRYFIAPDISGKNFYYKDSSGNILQDDNGKLLTELTLDAVEPVVTRIGTNKVKELCSQSMNLIGNERIHLDNERNLITNSMYNIRELRYDNKGYRKLQADKGYVSDKTISQYIENPQLLLTDETKEIYIERIPLSDRMNHNNLKYQLSKLSPEDLKLIMSDIQHLIPYIIDTFLTVHGMLIYKYDREKDIFNYHDLDINSSYENEEQKYQNLKMYEDNGDTVYHFVHRFNIPYAQRKHCREEFNKIKDISVEEFRRHLKDHVVIKDLSVK